MCDQYVEMNFSICVKDELMWFNLNFFSVLPPSSGVSYSVFLYRNVLAPLREGVREEMGVCSGWGCSPSAQPFMGYN